MGVALLLLCGSAFALSSVIRKSGKCLHTQPKELRRDIIYIVYENEREKKQIRMKCIYRLRCAQSSLPNMTFFFIPMSMIFTASVGSNHLQRPIQFLVIFSSPSSADGYIVYCREKKTLLSIHFVPSVSRLYGPMPDEIRRDADTAT
jgi:hypothetical protein